MAAAFGLDITNKLLTGQTRSNLHRILRLPAVQLAAYTSCFGCSQNLFRNLFKAIGRSMSLLRGKSQDTDARNYDGNIILNKRFFNNMGHPSLYDAIIVTVAY